MALPSAFRERLEEMEETRNQRVSFLHAEKQLQINNSQLLSSKLSNIRSLQQRCFKLDHNIASHHFLISSLKSQIDHLHSKHLIALQTFSIMAGELKSEVEELEELEKEKEKYFGSKTREMEEFREKVENYVAECRTRVEELRDRLNELKSTFTKLEGNIQYSSNSQLTAAELRKSELLVEKEKLDTSLASNYQIRAQLQKQLRSILTTQNEERSNPSQFGPWSRLMSQSKHNREENIRQEANI